MKTFDIRLKNEKENSYRLIIYFFAILHAILFIYFLFDKGLWKMGIAGLIFIALYSLIRLWWCRYSKQKFSYDSTFFMGVALVLQMAFPWLMLVDVFLSILSSLSLQPLILHFSPDVIKKRSFPYTKYKWSDVDNVVLKDNILTIDFKNNKLLQGEIQHYSHLGEKPVKEEAFNTFAQEHFKQ